MPDVHALHVSTVVRARMRHGKGLAKRPPMSAPHPATSTDDPEAMTWVDGYFARHLGDRMHRDLLPGLRSLSTAFVIDVTGAGAWRLAIEAGRLVHCAPDDGVDPGCRVTVAPADFAEIVAARCTPQSLFVRRRLAIAGDVFRALSAAGAMQEFFQHFPYPRNDA